MRQLLIGYLIGQLNMSDFNVLMRQRVPSLPSFIKKHWSTNLLTHIAVEKIF